jgi:hypothetical protein
MALPRLRDRFLYSEMLRKDVANEHNENMPTSMYEYFHGRAIPVDSGPPKTQAPRRLFL